MKQLQKLLLLIAIFVAGASANSYAGTGWHEKNVTINGVVYGFWICVNHYPKIAESIPSRTDCVLPDELLETVPEEYYIYAIVESAKTTASSITIPETISFTSTVTGMGKISGMEFKDIPVKGITPLNSSDFSSNIKTIYFSGTQDWRCLYYSGNTFDEASGAGNVNGRSPNLPYVEEIVINGGITTKKSSASKCSTLATFTKNMTSLKTLRITGDINTCDFTNVTAPALTTIEINSSIITNTDFSNITNLQTLAFSYGTKAVTFQYVKITDNPALATLTFPTTGLNVSTHAGMGTDVEISNNPGITKLEMPNTPFQGLTVKNNSALEEVSMCTATTLLAYSGSVVFEDNAKLSKFTAYNLRSLTIKNSALRYLNMNGVGVAVKNTYAEVCGTTSDELFVAGSCVGRLRIHDCDNLKDIYISSSNTVNEYLRIYSNPKLEYIGNYAAYTGTIGTSGLLVYSNPSFERFFSEADNLGCVQLKNNPKFWNFYQDGTTDGVEIDNTGASNTEEFSCYFGGNVENLTLTSVAVKKLNFNNAVDGLTIKGCTDLASLTFKKTAANVKLDESSWTNMASVNYLSDTEPTDEFAQLLASTSKWKNRTVLYVNPDKWGTASWITTHKKQAYWKDFRDIVGYLGVSEMEVSLITNVRDFHSGVLRTSYSITPDQLNNNLNLSDVGYFGTNYLVTKTLNFDNVKADTTHVKVRLRYRPSELKIDQVIVNNTNLEFLGKSTAMPENTEALGNSKAYWIRTSPYTDVVTEDLMLFIPRPVGQSRWSYIVNVIASKAEEEEDASKKYDLNGDGSVDVGDIDELVDYICEGEENAGE